ncbi:phage tail length tape measure family protein [Sphingomonas endophytica]|uniref:Bacteriophage tail tape measure N-terminal domain-containing protein n=1 Tax=Sphingomonas endophytica TaxID=869719 RepID=A0A147I3J1_9SPHN|nr:phage tail length tape measure family protein [Sphingomonas endophytica]KTT72616.1 hypothetical protein NS334_08455 [Sphingomonas endophytica]
MAETTERLLLQVDAATELLRRHLAEGEQPIDRFERRADRMARNVEQSIGEMGKRFGSFAALADDAATRAEKSFEASFSQVQRIAAQAIKGPTIDGRVNLGADDIRAGAAAAQDQARAFELIGEAAQRTAARVGDTSEATRLFIQATRASQQEAERKAAALLAEAGALERVEIELLKSGEATELFVTKHQRIAQSAAQAEQLALNERQAAVETRALAAAADMLRAEIDPMYLAQQRFNAEMDRADALLKAGIITQREYGMATDVSRGRLRAHAEAVTGAIGPSNQLVATTGAVRAAMQGASYQVQDTFTQLSMGANIFQVVAIQGGQLAGQFSMIEGKAGSFARFMIGPWGLAITGAMLVVGALTKDIDLLGSELDDEVDKLGENAKKTATAEAAKKLFARTERGLIEDVRALTDELQKQNDALKTNAERQNIRAKNDLAGLQKTRADLAAELEKARAEEERANAAPADPEGGIAVGRVAAQQQVTDLERRLATVDRSIKAANATLLETRKNLVAERADLAIDPIAAIKDRYEGDGGLIDVAKRKATAEETINGVLKRRLVLLKQQEQAEIGNAQRAQRSASRLGNDNQIGRTIDVAEATRIAASIGGRVTSGLRTRERQEQLYADKLAGRHNGPVAKPGTSDHERGQAIDIGFAPGLTVSKIRDAFAKEGVAIRQLLVERDQKVFHVAFGKAAPRGPSQATLDRRAETARKAVLHDDSEYTDQERAARQRLLDATRRTAGSEEQRDQLLRESIDAEAAATEKKIANEFEAGEITLAQAAHLQSINEATRVQRVQNIKVAAATRTIERRYTAEEDDLQSRLAQLRISEDLAVTQAERRKIARDILEAEQQLRRKALERVRDTSQDPVEVQRAAEQLGGLSRIERAERARSDRDNASPLDQYRDRLQKVTGDTRSAFEEAAVRGFQSLEDAGSRATASAVTNLLKLKGVAGEVVGSIIADLARLAIQKAIVAAIGGATPGMADGGAIGELPGFADGGTPGGRIVGPGTGRSDSILAILRNGKGAIRVSNGEFIVNERATRENLPLLHAINDNRLPRFANGGSIANLRAPTLPLSARGGLQPGRNMTLRVALSDDLHATIDKRAVGVAVEVVRATAPEIIDAASAQTIAAYGRPRI